MISLPLSEAEAFDYLSILQVKVDRGMDAATRYSEIARAIEGNGVVLEEILMSPAYWDLYRANSICFDAIERAHADTISAAEVQRINHKRFLAKRALQERFWPHAPLAERKSLDTPCPTNP